MCTPAPATTGRPTGRRSLSRGCTMRKRSPSNPGYLTVATTVPITSPSCIRASQVATHPLPEASGPLDVLAHLRVELGDHRRSDQVAPGHPTRPDLDRRFPIGGRPPHTRVAP